MTNPLTLDRTVTQSSPRAMRESNCLASRSANRRQWLSGLVALMLVPKWASQSNARIGDDEPLRDGEDGPARSPALDAWSGTSLAGWMTIDGQDAPAGWSAKDGMIALRKQGQPGGHIVTRQEFGDFELQFQWKIAPKGNSGLKYRVKTYGERTLGCEYQIYDAAGRPIDPKNQTASIYDLFEPAQSITVHPAGEWNDAKIVVQRDTLEHWINGELAVRAVVGSAEWKKRVAESKFNDVEAFSEQSKGRIMLTDHGSEVWYRAFVFRDLSGADPKQP